MFLEATSHALLGEPLVGAREVAAHLGIHVASVYRLAGRSNGIPVVRVGRGIRRFRPADVRAFVDRQTAAAQVRSSRVDQLLRPAGIPLRNVLATSPRQSVTATQESSAGSKRRNPEAER